MPDENDAQALDAVRRRVGGTGSGNGLAKPSRLPLNCQRRNSPSPSAGLAGVEEAQRRRSGR